MSRYERYRALRIEVEDRVATVTLDRPERLNAVNLALHEELSTVFTDLDADDSVYAVLLTGAGKAFCAGADMKASPEESILAVGWDRVRRDAERIVTTLLDCEKPVVAAVRGPAVGFGATLALLCDVVYAAEDARFGDTHVAIGLAAGDGGSVIWPLLVGPNKAKELLMTGDLLAARDAERIGLVNHVVPAERLLDDARAMARRLAHGPKTAIRATKQSVNLLVRNAAEIVLKTSLLLEGESLRSDEYREAVRAFLEKRPPKFA